MTNENYEYLQQIQKFFATLGGVVCGSPYLPQLYEFIGETEKVLMVLGDYDETDGVTDETKRFFADSQTLLADCGTEADAEANWAALQGFYARIGGVLAEISAFYEEHTLLCPLCLTKNYSPESAGSCELCGLPKTEWTIIAYLQKEGLDEETQGRSILYIGQDRGGILYNWLYGCCYENAITFQNNGGEYTNGVYDYAIFDAALLSDEEWGRVSMEIIKALKPEGTAIITAALETAPDQWAEIGENVYLFTTAAPKPARAIVKEHSNPLVSIIISCYNHEKYVENTINSILNQTYENVEIIIADNASTDRTPEILKKYEDKFTYIKYHEVTLGPRYHELVLLAKGKYVCPMTSDDLWLPDKLEKQVAYLEAHPSCSACFTWCDVVDEQGNVIWKDLFTKQNRGPDEWFKVFFLRGNSLSFPSAMIERELCVRMFYSIGMAYWQVADFYIWQCMALEGKHIYIVPEALTYHLRHDGNMSATTHEVSIREHNETLHASYHLIKNMDTASFKRIFHEDFQNPHADTEEELRCEKFFLLMTHGHPSKKMAAMLLFYDEYKNVEFAECLLKKYNFKLTDFVEFEKTVTCVMF
jgi:glycosyltransferase involved in cell wall biosynthesis